MLSQVLELNLLVLIFKEYLDIEIYRGNED
jgi:hypothetical protein